MKIPKRLIQKKIMLKVKICSIREKKEIDEEQLDQQNIEKWDSKSPLKGGGILKRIKGKPSHRGSYASGPCRYQVRGLHNYSMMCYFNSVLQNLLSLETLREHYVNTTFPGDSLASTFKELYVVTGPNKPTEPFEPIFMYYDFRAKARQFVPYEEHDSQELLLTLLNKLAEEDFSTPTFVDSVFRVETVTTITCSVCGTVSENHENHFTLGLPIPYKKRLSKWKKIIKAPKSVRKAANIKRGMLKTKGKDPESDDGSKAVNVTSVEGSERNDSSKIEDVTVKRGWNSDDESKVDAMAKVKGKSTAKDSESDDESKVVNATSVKGSGRDDLSKFDILTVSSRGSEVDALAKIKGKCIAGDTGIDDKSKVEDVMVSSDAMKAASAKVQEKSIAEGSGIDGKSEIEEVIVSSDVLAKVKGKSIVEDPGIDDESQVENFVVTFDEVLQAALAKLKEKSIVEDSGGDYDSEFQKFNVDSSYLIRTKSSKTRPPKKDTYEKYRIDNEQKGKRMPKFFTKWVLPQSLSPKKVLVCGRHSGIDVYGADHEDLEVDNTNGPVSLDSLLAEFLRTKAAPQDWCCGNCKAASGSSKVDIRLAPRILILHLLRFQQDPTRGLIGKIHGHVIFNEIINFSQFILGLCMPSSSSQTGEVRYRLMGIIEHKGTSGRGHYEAFVRGGCPGNKWFRCDDEDIIPATLEDVLRREAYLLFYQRL